MEIHSRNAKLDQYIDMASDWINQTSMYYVAGDAASSETYGRVYRANPLLQAFHIFFTITTTVLIFTGNTFLVILIVRIKALQSPQGVLLLSLASADFIVGVESLLGFVAVVTGKWPTPPIGCTIMGYAAEVSIAVNIFTIAMMSIDRWLVVHKPFRYETIMTVNRTLIVAIIIWLLSCALYTPFFFSCQGFEFEWDSFMCSLEIKTCQALVLTIVTFVRIPALIVMTTFTLLTCRTAQIHVRSIQASEAVVQPEENRHRTIRESLSLTPRKHIKTTIIVIFTLMATTLPMYILQVISTIDPGIDVPSEVVFVFTWLLLGNSYLNCFVWMITDATFRKGLKKLLRISNTEDRPRGRFCYCICACVSVKDGDVGGEDGDVDVVDDDGGKHPHDMLHMLIESLHSGVAIVPNLPKSVSEVLLQGGQANPAFELN